MKRGIIIIVLLSLVVFSLPVAAHEVVEYDINGKTYEWVVGSLGEPIVVDGKTGVDFGLSVEEGDEYIPVEDLDSLSVEIEADGVKKVFDLKAQWGKPGRYKADFIPTVETIYTYRFFGTLNDVPVDLSFSCNPAGHVMQGDHEHHGPVEVAEGITQVSHRGSFGCPKTGDVMGFPAATKTNLALDADLNREIEAREAQYLHAQRTAALATALAVFALLFAAVAAFMTLKKK